MNASEALADIEGRYRILAPLGRGAFAVAYRCEDLREGGEVVVKLYDLGGKSWSLLTSFEREAAVLAQLAHPSIPRYVEHAQLSDGRFMLVQSYAGGRSLAELLRDGRRFSDEEVAALTERVLSVLEYLQSLNPPIIHRDIKPGNLVLDDEGRVNLVDFGSVKEAFRRDSDFASTIAGTYGYMAPEQFQGRATIQSDLYGLAATLVHVLSHIPPSELPQDGLKLDFRESVKASAGTLKWLERMLEPDPRQRFGDAKQALAAYRERDATPLAVVAKETKVVARRRNKPPSGSRIVLDVDDGALNLLIPGGGFAGEGVAMFGFATFWLGFITFWTWLSRQGPIFFTLFSIPFWFVGIRMMYQALSAMFGETAIAIDGERYSVQKRLWGTLQTYEGRTQDLAGADLAETDTRMNGKRIAHCVLHAGVKDITFGAQLALAERRWVVDTINQALRKKLEP